MAKHALAHDDDDMLTKERALAIIEIWVNCPDAETANKISSALLKKKLIASANLYPEIRSIYPWNGKNETIKEIPLCLKTRKSMFDVVAKSIAALHPYEIPSIKSLEAADITKEYEQWVFDETIEPAGP